MAVNLALTLSLGCGASNESSAPVNEGQASEDTARTARLPGEIVTGQVEVGPLTFDVRMAGPDDGEVVLLLHGFPQTSHEWRQQLPALGEAGYRAVAPDQRGYSPGARPTSAVDYRLNLLVRDIVGIADAIGADRFHLVGHDWGAIVAWAVATAIPDRLITVTPISVPHLDAFARVLRDPASCQPAASAYFDVFVQPDSEDAFLADNATRLRSIYAGVDEAAIDEFVRVLGTKAALRSALNWYRANISNRLPLAPPLGNVQVPTMFVWSNGDTALCVDGAELTAEYIDAPYRFEVLEGVNHWIPDLAPAALNALLLDHLAAYSER
ncbi:MAG: alpha/beta fold hydrolase [Acidobacteriota bacterium]|nr:alpha/beta fold hydrolase [Acidobacteriota bacterium]